jgi:1-acyl-sn-glycerol-3-phosphate acyltransferase
VIAKLRGLVVYGWMAASMVACFVIQLPVMLLTGSAGFSIWLARRLWSPSVLGIGSVKLEVVRQAPLPEGPVIFAANHESALDIFALFKALDRDLRFAAKKELFDLPILGWYLRHAGFVCVDRTNHAAAVASLHEAARIVRDGTPLVFFPEGTRSTTGRIRPFKKGPFVVAMEAGVPVVPVSIAGASELLPRKSVAIRSGTIRLTIGAQVDPRTFADKSELLAEVRRRIAAQHVASGGLGAEPEPSTRDAPPPARLSPG